MKIFLVMSLIWKTNNSNENSFQIFFFLSSWISTIINLMKDDLNKEIFSGNSIQILLCFQQWISLNVFLITIDIGNEWLTAKIDSLFFLLRTEISLIWFVIFFDIRMKIFPSRFSSNFIDFQLNIWLNFIFDWRWYFQWIQSIKILFKSISSIRKE